MDTTIANSFLQEIHRVNLPQLVGLQLRDHVHGDNLGKSLFGRWLLNPYGFSIGFHGLMRWPDKFSTWNALKNILMAKSSTFLCFSSGPIICRKRLLWLALSKSHSTTKHLTSAR